MRVEKHTPGYGMEMRETRKAWIRISPWVIMGSLVVMVPIIIFTTMESIRTQRKNMYIMLTEKGAALIRSFEAGTRTGMMGADWSGARVQRLIMETAELPDIVYIMITNHDGTIMAHNQPMNIGKKYQSSTPPEPGGRRVHGKGVRMENGTRVFEEYRRFYPSRGSIFLHRSRRPHMDWFSPHMIPQVEKPPAQTIYLGLDMEPVEQIIRESIKQKFILTVSLLMYGLLGIVAIVIAQNYLSARASLSRVKALSDTLVEHMPIGLIVTGEKGAILAVNNVTERLLRISGDHVTGRDSREVLPPEITSLIGEIRGPDDMAVREVRVPVQDRTMTFETSASTLRDDESTFLGHIVLLRDITEIEHLKKEMERKERLASIGSLAAGVAHEIRNPLSSIKGFATYFKERYRDVPEDQRIAGIMVGEVERLNRVITQLLEFARPMDLRRETASLLEVVNRSLAMVENQAAERHVEIDRSGLGDEPFLCDIDQDKISQVLLNLFLNAMEAMDSGGRLTVSLEPDEKNPRIMVSVSDTGHGIAPQDLDHVFDPYFTTKQSGTGLGLAIAHKIVEAHGGDIKVESIQGQGTRVVVGLPAKGA
jgi:two-component system sensor histidine kinase HydH